MFTVALFAMGSLFVPARAFALTETPDGTWGVRGKTFALLQSGSTLYVGGKFSLAQAYDKSGSYAASSLTAFDMGTGAGISSFAPTVTLNGNPGTVKSLALSPDGTILYLGGKFDTVDHLTVKNLAAIDLTNGQPLSNWTPQLNQVNTILVNPGTGEVYVGGSFKRVDGKPRGNLAAFLPDATLDTNWKPSADDQVRKLRFATDGQTIFAAGHFTSIDGNSRQSVARLDTATGAVNAWAIPDGFIVGPMTAWDMAVSANVLYVGFGQGPNYYAAFHLDHGDLGDNIWLEHTPGNAESVALSADGSTLYVGGHFGTAVGTQQCGTSYLHGLLSADPATGDKNCNWLPHLLPDQDNFTGTWTILLTPTQIWTGGFFTQICTNDETTCVKQQSLGRFTI